MFLPTPPEWYTRPNWVAGFSCFSVLSLILHVIAVVAPYWGVFSISSLGITTSVYFGLWSKCTAMNTGNTVCLDWTSSTSSGALKATQIFGMIGVLTAMAGSFIFVLMALKNLMSRPALIVNVISFFVSAASSFLAIISFIVTFVMTPDSDSPSWCFILLFFPTVICGLTGGYLLLFAKKKGILFQKSREPIDYIKPPVSAGLPTKSKIKVRTINEPQKVDEEEAKRNKELIDSKII